VNGTVTKTLNLDVSIGVKRSVNGEDHTVKGVLNRAISIFSAKGQSGSVGVVANDAGGAILKERCLAVR